MIPYYFAEKEGKGRYVVYLKYLGGGNRYPIEEFSTAKAARAFVRRRNAAT